MAADKITIGFDFQAAKALGDIQKSKKELSDLQDSWSKASDAERKAALQASRTTPWKLLTTDLGKLGDALDSNYPRLTRFAQGIGSVAGGVAGATLAISALALRVGQLAGEHESQARAVTILGDAYEHVRNATNDTVAAQDALRLQQGLVQSGLEVSGEQLGQMAQRAREYALATGVETPQALGEMLDAMRGLESEGLRKFGITLNATGDRQRDFNTAVASSATAQRDAIAESRKWGTALTGVALAQDRLASTMQSSQRTVTEEVDRTTRAFSQMTGGIAAAVARSLRLSEVFSFMATDVIPTLFDSAGSDARAQRDTDASIALRRNAERAQERGTARRSLESLRTGGRLTAEQFEEFSSALTVRGASRDDFIRVEEFARRAGSEAAPVAQSMMREVMSPLLQAARAQQEQEHRAAQLRQDISDMNGAGERKAQRAERAGQGGGAHPLRDAIRAYQAAIADAPDGAVTVTPADMPQNPRESATAYYVRLTGIQQGFNSAGAVNDLAPVDGGLSVKDLEQQADLNETMRERAIASRARSQRLSDRDRETRRSARGQSVLGRVEDMAGLQRDEAGNLRPIDAASEGIGLLGKALPTLQSGFAEMWTTIADGSASAGDAVQAFAAKSLQALGQLAIQEGTAMLFKAIPAAFTAPPLAVAYGVGGAGLIALGVGLGAAGAAIKPPPASTGAASTGSARAASGMSAPRANESAAPVTIVLSSLVPPGPGELQRLVDAGSQAGRYNLDRRRDMLPRQVRA